MPLADPDLLDTAAAWLVRTRDPAFRDWEALTGWLECDPARNRAYEAALDAHDAAAALHVAKSMPPARVLAVLPRGVAQTRRWSRAWIGAAAVLIAGITLSTVIPRHQRYSVATAPGEQRLLRLADGTTIAMNGGTRLTLDRSDRRAVRLDAGEAMFGVVHDAAHPFAISAGDTSIRDVGTAFDVVRSARATDVAVAEGAVVYDPDGAEVELTAGRTLHDPDVGMIEIGDVDRAAVGGWRTGRLIYRSAPIAAVAADIARLIGEPITVAPDVATRPFSGTIAVRGVEHRTLFARVSAIMAVNAVHGAGGWRLTSVPGEAR